MSSWHISPPRSNSRPGAPLWRSQSIGIHRIIDLDTSSRED